MSIVVESPPFATNQSIMKRNSPFSRCSKEIRNTDDTGSPRSPSSSGVPTTNLGDPYILAKVANPEPMASTEREEELVSKSPMRNTFVAPSNRELDRMFLSIDENDSSNSLAPVTNRSTEQKIDSNTIDKFIHNSSRNQQSNQKAPAIPFQNNQSPQKYNDSARELKLLNQSSSTLLKKGFSTKRNPVPNTGDTRTYFLVQPMRNGLPLLPNGAQVIQKVDEPDFSKSSIQNF